MNFISQIARQFEEVQLNGTWVATNFKKELSTVDYKAATTKVGSLNTIADLAFHINYYVAGILQVLEGGSLDIRDKYSFDIPPINSQQDWQKLLNKIWSDAEKFTQLLAQLPEEKLEENFANEKYGNYFRNISGMIQHSYYHLGQIVLIKKIISEKISC